MPTITSGTTVITPALILGYESRRSSGNLVHSILGRVDPYITRQPASLRDGTLRLFFLDEASAAACEEAHTVGAAFTLDYPELPTANMTYVLAEGGTLARALDPATRLRWVVSVDYQEIGL